MDVELVTDGISEDENFGFDDGSEDYLNYEGERCGICMDVVIDRGVLDCCQHWFCFACIDNWATITSLCPLCQNEFQLITCVPVHDTVGSSQTDDEADQRDEDWFVEGKTNTLSFPSYYIDENAVVCLDGDGCKIRSGSVEIGEDSDIDTSIACDSCDKWYHAFCVGFDPEGTCEGSWLCPGCTVAKGPQRSDRASQPTINYQNAVEIAGGDYLGEASFSGRVSVSVADDGETAVVISLVEGNQKYQESDVKCSKDMDNKVLSSSTSSALNAEALPEKRNSLDPDLCQQETEDSLSPAEQKICANDTVGRAPTHLNNKTTVSGLGLDLGISMGSDTLDMKNNNTSEDQVAGSLEGNNRSEDLLPAANVVPNEIKVFAMKSMLPNEKQTTSGTGAKRKHGNRRNAGGEIEATLEAKLSRKKIKAERDGHPISLTDQKAASHVDDSNTTSMQRSMGDSTYKCSSGKENGVPDIMDIVQETDHRKERETAAGLRLKKIMRRTGENKDSLVLVQELRKKIRDAVRNKSSEEVGQNRFDPKLLDAFRAALAGSGAENRKPSLDIKAKRALLQKGKVRESLTKKIYGTGGKRKRAWTRECEVEFWKHRCMKGSKPEKVQTLKSVLDLLRDESDHTKKLPGDEQEAKGSSILSRLYLADSSVFPRKNDIKPVSALKAVSTPEHTRESGSTERASKSPNNQSDINKQKNSTLSEVIAPSLESKDAKNHLKGAKSEAASGDAQLKRHLKGAPRTTAIGGVKIPLWKDTASKPDSVKGDKRQWALELLARKTAASGKSMQDKEEDPLILKGHYPLLAQLPKDMRPVLAPCRHNKIPTSVRQVQLYRLTEHFLKKANLSKVCQSAETELAVADAVNIEKDVANRSNSKVVYQNLCSQERLRRSEDINSDRAEEINHCSTSGCPSVEASEEASNSSFDLVVNEALKNAGLMSDSPPSSPSHPTEDADNNVGSPENSDDGPDNVIEVDSHPDLDIYGDFEYSLEDDDFIGAGVLNTTKLESEPPKIKLLFSSLKPEKPNGILDFADHEMQRDVEPLAGPSELDESQNKTSAGSSTVDDKVDECGARKSSDEDDEECELLYGPDIEPLIEKYPETAAVMPFGQAVNNELHGENEDDRSNDADKSSGQASEDHANTSRAATEESNQPSSDTEKRERADKEKTSNSDTEKRERADKEKTSNSDTKQSENHSMVMKKVETYIKEHIRPLCKSGVITVEQYRWAVGKTTEKVMKYHSKERNANFLIKEGEKVKKLAQQYVEASQQKTKT